MKCPCLGCEGRFLNCHSFCEKYEEWKTEHAEIVKQQKKQRAYVVKPSDFLGTTPPPGKHGKKKNKRYGKS